MPKISIIAAIGLNNELGKDNDLIWKIPEDMKRFKEITFGHTVIMGRKTFESIPEKFRPLPNRINIVVSRNKNLKYDGTVMCESIEDAIDKAKVLEEKEIFIIGGGEIYRQGIKYCDKVYLTQIQENHPADSFFPNYSEFQKVVYEEEKEYQGTKYKWIDLEKTH